MALTKKYEADLDAFGAASFQTKLVKRGSGAKDQEKEIAILNEPQATFLVTLMRNSPEVVQFKVALVKAFYSMREKLHRDQVRYLQGVNDTIKAQNEKLTRENRALVEKNKKLQTSVEALRESKGTLSPKEQYEIISLVKETADRLGVATANIYKRIYEVFQVPSYKLLSHTDVEFVKRAIENTDPRILTGKPKAKDVERVYKFTRPFRVFFSELNKLNTEKDLYDLMDCIELVSLMQETANDSKRLQSIQDYLTRLQAMFLKNRLYIECMNVQFPLVDRAKNTPYVRIRG